MSDVTAEPDAGETRDVIAWDEVRKAYELSAETVEAIRKRFGLTIHGLRSRRIREGWTARPPVAQPLLLPRKVAVGEEARALKLNRLVLIGTAMLEKRLAEEGLTEANARTLTELCRAEELLMRSTKQKTGKTRETKNSDAVTDFRDDPAWLNAELGRRLARLLAAGEARASDEGGDGRGEANVSRELAG
jgi:hypothetical protein